MADIEWQEVVAPRDLRVVSRDGAFVAQLQANTPTKIHPDLYISALTAGCLPVVVAAEPVVLRSHGEVVDALVDAMLDLMTNGRKNQLLETGEPKASALKARVGDFTDEQRVEAWNRVLEESTAPADE
jgi:hypothetical protein